MGTISFHSSLVHVLLHVRSVTAKGVAIQFSEEVTQIVNVVCVFARQPWVSKRNELQALS